MAITVLLFVNAYSNPRRHISQSQSRVAWRPTCSMETPPPSSLELHLATQIIHFQHTDEKPMHSTLLIHARIDCLRGIKGSYSVCFCDWAESSPQPARCSSWWQLPLLQGKSPAPAPSSGARCHPEEITSSPSRSCHPHSLLSNTVRLRHFLVKATIVVSL
jgi:hypothetical protein